MPTQLSVSVNTVVEMPTGSTRICVIVRGAVLGLTMVICCKALVTLIVSLPKFKLAGTMEILGLLAGSILATNALPAVPVRVDL